MRASRIPASLVLLLAAALAGGCGDAPEAASREDGGREPEPRRETAIFVDAAAETGLDFVHFNGMTGEVYFSEMVGSGVALLDYDQDGDLDVFLVQGGLLAAEQAIFPPPPEMMPLRDRLYRNDLEIGPGGERRLRFTDVTAESGLVSRGYGVGVASADVDNDGWPDLYVLNFGVNELWLGGADGTFRRVGQGSALDDPRWSASASFLDYDRDGFLDLYVADYVRFTLENHKPCRNLTGEQDYCGPNAYDPESDRLLRNRGDGSFEDVSGRSGILDEPGAGLGVVTADFNEDGWPDLYVANDGMPNVMWINRGDGTFRNEALAAGCALDRAGQAEAGMGVACGDADGDGDEDLLVTHLTLETNTLYRNDGQGLFEDVSLPSGLGGPSWSSTGFGTAWLDYDNDGRLDLMAVNGAVKKIPELAAAGDPYPLAMRNQLWHNRGDGFEEVSREAGEVFALAEVSRGLAVGDLDNDGDVDAVVTNNSGPVRLLLNLAGSSRPWVGLRLLAASGRDAHGAWVEIERPGRPSLWRRARTDGSFASADDPRLLVGLGDGSRVAGVVVRWGGGAEEAGERFTVETGRYQTLVEGRGEKLE